MCAELSLDSQREIADSKQVIQESPSIQQILFFWFGDQVEDNQYDPARIKLWFGNDPAQDQIIRDLFEGTIDLASNGTLDNWKNTPEGRLALILILDQFPRNIYRGNSKAFAYDSLAQKKSEL